MMFYYWYVKIQHVHKVILINNRNQKNVSMLTEKELLNVKKIWNMILQK